MLQNVLDNTDDVLRSPKKDKWINAMEQQMKSIKENEVWELVELPTGQIIIGSKWVYVQTEVWSR